jgi:hypothetical protein
MLTLISTGVLLHATGCTAPPPDAGDVTFNTHVAPILREHCMECHQANSYAPFALVTYQDARRRATQIVELTAARKMPPWTADPTFSKLAGARILSQEELDTLAAWLESGAPEGATALAPAGTTRDSWQYGTPDVVLELDEPYIIPASGPDRFRAFAVKVPDRDGPQWLEKVELQYTAPRAVHHSVLYLDRSGQVAEYDAADPGPGFEDRMGELGDFIGGRILASSYNRFTPGSGTPLDGPAWLAVSHHFSPVGQQLQERTRIGLHLTEEPPKHFINMVAVPPASGAFSNLQIPAGAKEYRLEETYKVPVDCTLTSMVPHMHYLGRNVVVTAETPDGKRHNLIRIPDWQFEWQTQYSLETPLPLPAGSLITAEFTFDNSDANPRNPYSPPREAIFGDESTDEMATVLVMLRTESPAERDALAADAQAYELEAFMTMDLTMLQRILLNKPDVRALTEEEQTALVQERTAEYLQQRSAWEAQQQAAE